MELSPRQPDPAELEAASEHENLVSAIALGKTLAFLVYSFLAGVVSTTLGYVVHPSEEGLGTRILTIFTVLEIGLLFLVVKGWLPATSGAAAVPFSEKQAAWGIALLSFIPWLFRPDPTWFAVFVWLVNGLLLLVAVVFFVVKSVLTRKFRLEVLAVAVIPAAQLYAASLAA